MKTLAPIHGFNGPNRFLSNFHPCTVTVSGIDYPSAENAYQAGKSLDRDVRLTFQTMTPGQAKRAGRRVEPRPDWDVARLEVMELVTRAKYTDTVLRRMLLRTGDSHLVETNTWGDRYWGRDEEGRGLNMLGRILMIVRADLSGTRIEPNREVRIGTDLFASGPLDEF